MDESYPRDCGCWACLRIKGTQGLLVELNEKTVRTLIWILTAISEM